MVSSIRIGLGSTKIVLTEVGKEWFLKAYPPSIVYEYDMNEPFDLKSMGQGFVDILCPLGIPYRIPCYIDEEITFKMDSAHIEKKRLENESSKNR